MSIQTSKPYFSEHMSGPMTYTHVLSRVVHPLRDAPLTEQAAAQFSDACSTSKKGVSATMCFSGPSGTGKTLLLANLAHSCKLPVIFVEKAFFNALPKSRLAALFAFAEKQKGILFFDEADALTLGNITYEDGENIDSDLVFKLVEQRQATSILAVSNPEALARCKLRLKFVVETK